jgi:hypothetical protein
LAPATEPDSSSLGSTRRQVKGEDGQRQFRKRFGGVDAVVAVAMPSRRGHEIGAAVEALECREVDSTMLSRGGCLAFPAWANPRPALVSGECVADAFRAAVAAREEGELLECEGRAGAIAQEVRETL